MKTIVLLTNTSFRNKGDALMNRALLDRLEGSYDVAFPLSAVVYSRSLLHQHDVVLLSDLLGDTPKRKAFRAAISAASAIVARLPVKARRAGGILTEDDPQIVIDVSGYAYGDHWGAARLEKTIALYARWSGQGKKIILMPKTWGPFDTIDTGLVRELFEHVDLAFARDQSSLALLKKLLTPALLEKLAFAPDYTHAVRPLEPKRASEDAYLVIPSSRMIDSGTATRESYCRFFEHVRTQLSATGHKVLLVLHETSGDIWFQDNAGKMGFAPENVVRIEDERELKGFIAGSRGVVTSRLHGLYNALNTTTPVLVAAWNFKYKEALEQYGCDQCLLDPRDLKGSFDAKSKLLIDEAERELLKTAMRSGKQRSELATHAMWERVLRVCEQVQPVQH